MNSKVTQLLTMAGLTALAPLSFASEAAPSIEHTSVFTASNPSANARLGAQTLIPAHLIAGQKDFGDNVYVEIDGKPTASQMIDTDGDKTHDALLVVADYPAKTTKNITVTTLKGGTFTIQHPPLTQTDMGVRVGGTFNKGRWKGGSYQPVSQLTNPAGHTIGDKLYRYEGFGWESDKIGYRFYFDDRGLVDIFSKSQPELVLHNVGHDGDNYHALNDWGMDTLKVGPSLGLAGIAAWQDDAITPIKNIKTLSVKLSDGPLQSTATVNQEGWKVKGKKVDVERQFSIRAHSHLTHTKVSTSTKMKTLAIGVVKHGVDTITSTQADSEWSYLATFGDQSFIKDKLGMVVFFKTKDLVKLTEDTLNELAIVKMGKQLEFYFGSRWEKEASPVTTKQQFVEYLEATRKALNNPIKVTKVK